MKSPRKRYRRGLPLPLELVYDIFDYLGSDETVELAKRDIYALSLTSRALRQLALFRMCRSIEISWTDAMSGLGQGDRIDGILAQNTRSLVFSAPSNIDEDNLSAILHNLRISKALSVFTHLTELDLSRISINPQDLHNYGISTTVKTLILCWSMESDFPDLSKLGKSSTLVVDIERTEEVPHAAFSPFLWHPVSATSYNTLTGLCINERACRFNHRTMGNVGWFFQNYKSIKLPRLRHFTLTHTFGPFDDVYAFIKCHPSILEVNISGVSDETALSLQSMISLIEGTGVWQPSDPDEDRHDDPICRDGFFTLCAFGFVRIPNPSKTQSHRYIATSLTLNQTTGESDRYEGEEPQGDLESFLELGSYPVFSLVDHLTLTLDDLEEQTSGFKYFMDILTDVLTCWPKLKSLRLVTRARKGSGWNGLQNGFLPFFDEAIPFNEGWSTCWGEKKRTPANLPEALTKLLSEGYLQDEKRGADKIAKEIMTEIRHAFHIPKKKLDMNDEEILTEFWHWRNQEKMSPFIDKMARLFKNLEEFSWSPRANGSWAHRLTNKWTWTFSNDKKENCRLVDHVATWCEKKKGVKLPILIGTIRDIEEKRSNRVQGFNPFNVRYWP